MIERSWVMLGGDRCCGYTELNVAITRDVNLVPLGVDDVLEPLIRTQD